KRRHGSRPSIDQTAVCEVGPEGLQVLERKWCGRELQLVPWPGSQCGVSAITRGWGSRLCHAGRSQRPASKGRIDVSLIRQTREGVAGMGTEYTACAGKAGT